LKWKPKRGTKDYTLAALKELRNIFIGPLATGRTNRKATTSILTTHYPGIKRSPNNYSRENGIEKLLYLSLSNIKFKVVTPQTAAEEIHGESKSSGPAEATMMSDNDLLLYLGPSTSGDKDVDHTAPKNTFLLTSNAHRRTHGEGQTK